MGLVVGFGLALLMGTLFAVLPRVFTDDEAVLEAVRGVYWFVVVMQPINAVVFVWDGIGIGARAFRFLATSMLMAAVTAIGVLLAVLPIGAGLPMVWWGLTVLMGVRLGAMAWWHYRGPLAVTRVAVA